MAYTKAQAHEYYENYTKKGLKKGRKKGKKKKSNAKKKTKGVVKKALSKSKKKTISKEQRQACNDECKAARELIAAQKKEFMRQYREQVKELISSLRAEMKERLKDMPKGPEKDALKAEYQKRISDIQELKRSQTEQFNREFQEQKEKTVNGIRKKYGLEPLKSRSSSSVAASLTEAQSSRLSSALEDVRKR